MAATRAADSASVKASTVESMVRSKETRLAVTCSTVTPAASGGKGDGGCRGEGEGEGGSIGGGGDGGGRAGSGGAGDGDDGAGGCGGGDNGDGG
eukprot:773574-Prymnesium_polylepis.3